MSKIYIDTHFKTGDSQSNTDFKMQLLQPLELKEDIRCFVADVNIPNTWYSIEETNDNLYLEVVEGSITKHVSIKLARKNYSILDLALEIQTKLSTGLSKTFSITYNANTGRLTFNVVQTDFTYSILTDKQLKSMSSTWKGKYYNPTNIKSCNDTMSNVNAAICSHASPFVSGCVNVINYDSLYIHSNISSLDHVSPNGAMGDIIKKVSTIASFGNTMTNYNINVNDYTYIRNRNTLTVLEFKITDVYGNVIDLHGSHVSFTLMFLHD